MQVITFARHTSEYFTHFSSKVPSLENTEHPNTGSRPKPMLLKAKLWLLSNGFRSQVFYW